MPVKPVPMKPTKAWAVVNKISGCCIEVFQPLDTRADAKETAMLAGDERLARVTIAEGDGWLPIETAPKDGTKLLLASSKDKPWVWCGYWSDDKESNQFGEEGWVDGATSRNELFYVMTNATHWQPLPAPPKARKK